jgi:CRP/FNR family transcriptional regulator
MGLSSDLSDDDMAKVDAVALHTEYTTGATLIYEGDTADRVYNITRGVVRVTKLTPDGRRAITGFLFPGDFLGLSYGGKYSYSAEAINEVSACRFGKEPLVKLFEEIPRLERRLLSMVSDELLSAQNQMVLLARKTPKEKLATFLLQISERLSHNQEVAPDEFDLAMSRADIADYLGLTIETVSRTFTTLHTKDGLIELPTRHRVRIADRAALVKLAEANAD